MIIMKIQGGLGNQMYQYALGRYLSGGGETGLQFEMSYFDLPNARPFMLDKFNTKGTFSSNAWLKFYLRIPRGRRVVKHFLRPFLKVVQEPTMPFHSEILQYRGTNQHVYLSGYWLSPKYFNAIKDVLKKEFHCKVPLSDTTKYWLEQIQKDDGEPVSLHVRRGDYLASAINRQIYKQLKPEYYQECVDRLKAQVKKPSLYIFSNDMEWTKENLDFAGIPVHFVEGNDENHGFEDMIIMWKCKHHIIANSTFSWWGAYLSEQEGYTYGPSDWFNFQDDAHDIRDLYPDNWIQVKA